MFKWLQHRDKIEKLQEHYKKLMRKSFELSLKNKKKGDAFHDEALRLKNKIQQLRYQDK